MVCDARNRLEFLKLLVLNGKLEGNVGTLFYGISVLNCMTTSLAGHGEGLGTLGLPERELRELCAEVGLSTVRHVPIEDPFNNLYEITP